MSIVVRIPTPLRRLTNEMDKIVVEGDTLSGVIESMNEQFPGIRERICDGEGQLRNFVNVYVNGEDVRFLRGIDTPTADGDEVSVVPAVAGGAGRVRYFHYGR